MVASPHSSRPGEPATLGRLGGLAPGEFERGAKAIWLAGGGYRAALFHLGALTRFNELGILAQTGTVGAVAGGSIVAALLATRIPWPLHGGYREWPERVAEPLRAIARRNVRARAFLRWPFPGGTGGAALEERYARELVRSLGGEYEQGPRFVFGASGLILSGLAAGWEDCIEWHIGDACEAGYGPDLVTAVIAVVRTDLDAFGEAEQAVLENHGYLLADAALRARGLATAGRIELRPPAAPHPDWMNEDRVRRALDGSARQTPLGRLRPRRVARAERTPQPASAELTALLERHRPLLHYDSLESCRADSVATICELVAPGRCNSLHRADGSLIAAAAPSGEVPRLELDFLGGPSYANGQPSRHDDYLDECGASYAADALAMRRGEGRADVVYGRARHDRQGRLWLQYWLFFYYDDRGLLGLEQHEGDWELVQIRLDAAFAPEAATFARHGGERLSWDQVEVAESGEGPALVVYPARGSHAPLPRAGSFDAAVVPDHNDGLGPRLRPALAVIADDGPGWVQWPGRWGSTRRREFFEADSPRGPREQPHWWDPAELHREARPWRGGKGAVGQPPPRPSLAVHREGELAVVSYGFGEPGTSEAEPARFVAAPFAAGDVDSCITRSLTIEGRQGSFALRLPGERRWSGVRVGVASEQGVFGETLSVPFE